jgi:hypothetical protein
MIMSVHGPRAPQHATLLLSEAEVEESGMAFCDNTASEFLENVVERSPRHNVGHFHWRWDIDVPSTETTTAFAGVDDELDDAFLGYQSRCIMLSPRI